MPIQVLSIIPETALMTEENQKFEQYRAYSKIASNHDYVKCLSEILARKFHQASTKHKLFRIRRYGLNKINNPSLLFCLAGHSQRHRQNSILGWVHGAEDDIQKEFD